MNKRYCLTLDLKNDQKSILQYEQHHRAVWPEVLQSIKGSGILNMEIYRLDTRLFMIMEVDGTFSFARKHRQDLQNPKVQQWENLMNQYQQPLPGTAPGEKWRLMDKIFQLENN
jgi:L-rhamnose mutarotase